MSDALWAARQGDALAHSSVMADVFGGALEVFATVGVGALVSAAIVAAAGATVATAGLGACVLGCGRRGRRHGWHAPHWRRQPAD